MYLPRPCPLRLPIRRLATPPPLTPSCCCCRCRCLLKLRLAFCPPPLPDRFPPLLKPRPRPLPTPLPCCCCLMPDLCREIHSCLTTGVIFHVCINWLNTVHAKNSSNNQCFTAGHEISSQVDVSTRINLFWHLPEMIRHCSITFWLECLSDQTEICTKVLSDVQ